MDEARATAGQAEPVDRLGDLHLEVAVEPELAELNVVKAMSTLRPCPRT